MSLYSLYELNFSLLYIHKLSLTEVESMIPWERDLYVERLGQYLEKQELEARQAVLTRNARRR
jgi:hypothetical protein